MDLDCVFQAFPRLETERFIIRRLQLSDAESLFAILADEEVTRFYDEEAFIEISQAREQIKPWASGFDERG